MTTFFFWLTFMFFCGSSLAISHFLCISTFWTRHIKASHWERFQSHFSTFSLPSFLHGSWSYNLSFLSPIKYFTRQRQGVQQVNLKSKAEQIEMTCMTLPSADPAEHLWHHLWSTLPCSLHILSEIWFFTFPSHNPTSCSWIWGRALSPLLTCTLVRDIMDPHHSWSCSEGELLSLTAHTRQAARAEYN